MKKKILTLILVLSMITISLIFIIIRYNGNIGNNSNEGKTDPIVINDMNILKYPTNRSNYFAVKNVVNKYINYVIDKQNSNLLKMISSQYIKEAAILDNNIVEKVKDSDIEYSSNYYIIIDKVYMSEENETIQNYLMELLYYNKDNNQKYKTKLIVQIDISNATYQILPYQYMKQKGYENLKLGDYFSTGITKIEDNGYNTYKLVPISSNSMAERYFNLYLDYLQYDKEQAYYLLNKEYREKRFGDINNYIMYLNSMNLDDIMLQKYQVNEYEEYTQYICIDSIGNYYIFRENNIMDFEIILDVYTIDLPEFTEKYNSASEQQKVALNIEKFIQAINDKSYYYAYNCLADSYKNNYFKTQEEFENYAKEIFYGSSIEYNAFNVEGELYTYSVVLTNNEKQINKTFIMQLGEGTEFVLSFNK